MDRRYPDKPMVGVGAIIFRRDRVLLIKRGREPAYGMWSVPGGLVEVGESLREAVRREVLEEVGLDVEVRDLVAALDRVILDEQGRIEYHYILLDFICESEEGNPAAASDVLDCSFAAVDSLSQYSMTEGTEQVIRRAFDYTEGKVHPTYDPFL